MDTEMCKLLFVPTALKLQLQLPCCPGEGRAEGLLVLVSSPRQGVWVPLTTQHGMLGTEKFSSPREIWMAGRAY